MALQQTEYEVTVEENLPSDDVEDDGPTFEDLAIDDTLSDLDRVTKYVCSNIALQRVIHVKMLSETAIAVGFQSTCDRLIPLLEPLVCDLEYVVRQHVAFQFSSLCRFLVESDAESSTTGYQLMLDKIVPLIAQLVSDDQHEVRSAAADSLIEIAGLIKPDDQGQHILTIVLPLAHDDDNEQLRISAVRLYDGLAEHLGPELCQQFCVPELISLSEDQVFRVRKSTAQSFSNISRIVGAEIGRERLLPAFQRLASDDIWGVRKACAESLVAMSETLEPEIRAALLVPLFDAFTSDTSRWVRLAAYQSLGPFLSTLPPDDVSEELLDDFLSMGNSSSALQLGGSGEVDIKFHCAFSFPAVVSIVGKNEWHRLAPVFVMLSQDSFWKIRRTLAYSLHELAKMLGPEITESELTVAFDYYLQDVPEVRLGAMLHFADFLEHLSPDGREKYLNVLRTLRMDEQVTNWRLRQVLSSQLCPLCSLFPPDQTFDVLAPLVLQLVTDQVSSVREESFQACPVLLDKIDASRRQDVITQFMRLATSSHFKDRQIFVKVARAFIDHDGQEVFESDMVDTFFTLAKDNVYNVRHLVASVVLEHRDFFRQSSKSPTWLVEGLQVPYETAEALLVVFPEPPPRVETQDTEQKEDASTDANG